MAGLTIQANPGELVARALLALVYVRPSWSDEWVLADHGVFERVAIDTGAARGDRLQFLTPYGDHKSAFDSGFAPRDPLALIGWWARLELVGEGAAETVFVGQILGEERQVMGASQGPTGFQRWIAYGGQMLLRRRAVSSAFFEVNDAAVQVGWAPGFNTKDARGLLKGNRSATDATGTYIFGGSSTWTRRQALEYLLERFMLGIGDEEIEWTVSGPAEALDQIIEDDVPLGVSATAEDVVRKIIPRQAALDWIVVPGDGSILGYELRVFSLLGSDVAFHGATLPRNPDVTTIDVSETIDVEECRVSRDMSCTGARLSIVGARTVVCGTLRGSELEDPASLVAAWTPEEEAAYAAGVTDNQDATEDDHDAFRAQDRLRPVWQRYSAPVGWDRPASLRPKFDGSGELSDEPANHQEAVRSTLSWTPLREGWDYSVDPALNKNPVGVEADFAPPLVVARNDEADNTPYVAVDKHGVSVSALKTDLGVLLGASPNHKLARGRWDADAAAGSNFDPETDEGSIDTRTLAATLAWRSDERLRLEATLEGALDDGTVLEIEIPDAEVWWLAPGTIVGVSTAGGLLTSGDAGRVLRNDADLLAAAMAGAIARYLYGRNRAEVTFKGLKPWTGLVGSMLATVEEGGESHGINAPITSVELVSGMNASPRTLVRAGYAS